MSRFGPDPQSFFDNVYRDVPPWDIRGPQPALMELLRDFPPADPILDVGCGSGDHAIAIAREGHAVLGIDIVAAAIDQAREKAAALPATVAQRLDFETADALRPAALGRRFGAVVDSGFYHLFDPEVAAPYANELAAALVPGGRYYLLAFAVEFPIPNVPRAVTEDELRALFAAGGGWRILELRAAQFESRVAPVPAIAACMERLPAAATPA